MSEDLPAAPRTGTAVAAERPRDRELAAAISYVTAGSPLQGLKRVTAGESELLLVEGSADAKQFDEIQGILSEYASRDSKARPLSLAVFGPPGSGKSRWVRTMIGSAEGFELEEINLAQLQYTTSLGAEIGARIEVQRVPAREKGPRLAEAGSVSSLKPKIKAFFFDEFDSPLKDEPLGWLRWFLGLMQDGKFSNGGKTCDIGKVVLLFAGGTAVSLRDFEERAQLDPVAYKNKKVPDFISRLRGFVNIQGINDGPDRVKRRAVILRDLLRFNKTFEGKTISEDLAESLLDNVHFIHGGSLDGSAA
jgi:hypothetical protein